MNRKEAQKELMEYGLTKAQALALIEEAEADNCEPTSRLMPDCDKHLIEYSASAATEDGTIGVTVYYYQTVDAVEKNASKFSGDLSYLDWEIERYETW